jgi:prepilin-type N-terminal cleavage/methylation domain-containing protein
MLRTNVHRSGRQPRGFSLVEVMVATSIFAIVLVGVLAAYLFVGRNLTRLVNLQHQEVESRRTLRTFTQDLSAAININNTTLSSSTITLTKPTTSGTTTVTFTYSAGAGTFVRTEGAASQTLLSGLTSLAMTYYSESGNTVTGSPLSVKAVELTYSSTAGSTNSGTLAKYKTVSPRVLLRNKPALQ